VGQADASCPPVKVLRLLPGGVAASPLGKDDPSGCFKGGMCHNMLQMSQFARIDRRVALKGKCHNMLQMSQFITAEGKKILFTFNSLWLLYLKLLF
jgi:hypothetical protein